MPKLTASRPWSVRFYGSRRTRKHYSRDILFDGQVVGAWEC